MNTLLLQGRRLLYVVVGVTVLLFLIIGITLANIIGNAAKLNVNGQTAAVAQSTARALANTISNVQGLANAVAQQDGVISIVQNTASQSTINRVNHINEDIIRNNPQVLAFYYYDYGATYTNAGVGVDPTSHKPTVQKQVPAFVQGSALRTALNNALKPDAQTTELLTFDANSGPFGIFFILVPVPDSPGKPGLGVLVEQVDAGTIFGPYIQAGDNGNIILYDNNIVIGPDLAAAHARHQLPVLTLNASMDQSISGGLNQTPVGYTLGGDHPQFNLQGTDVTGGVAKVPGDAGLSVISYTGSNVVTDSTNRTVTILFVLSLLIIAGVVALFLYLSRQVQRTEQQSAQLMRARSESLTEDIVNVSQALAVAREGDLTVQVPDSESEVGLLSLSLNGLISDYSQIVGGIVRASHAVQEGAARVDEGVRRIVDVATGQAESVAVVATSVEDVAGSAVEVQQATAMATGLAASARVAVHSGQESVGRIADAVDAIKEAAIGTTREFKRLQEDSIRLTDLVASVKNNAENLDMQAANATLEARHLGTESGSAFAANIGRLARQAQETLADAEGAVRSVVTSIDEVNRRIERISEQVRRGVEEVRTVRVTFDEITQTNSRLVQFIDNVADTAGAQANSAQQAAHSISEIAQVFEQFTELLITSGDEIANMRLIVAGLRESVADLKVDEGAMLSAA